MKGGRTYSLNNMDTFIFRLDKEMLKLESMVKRYSTQKDSRRSRDKTRNVSEDLRQSKKNNRSVELKPKRLTIEAPSNQKVKLKLPVLASRFHVDSKTDRLSSSREQQARREFVQKARQQRQVLSHSRIQKKKDNPMAKDTSLQINGLNKQKLQNATLILQSQCENSPTPLEQYFKRFNTCIGRQVAQELKMVSKTGGRGGFKDSIMDMFRQHDRELSSLRKQCRHLQHYDTLFFTSDMYQQ